MNHLIFGAGNLGLDLQAQITASRMPAPVLLSKSMGFDASFWDNVAHAVKNAHYETIWYCIGGGSVAETVADPKKAHWFNVELPLEIAAHLPAGKRLVVFSSDYVADANKPYDPYATCTLPASTYAEQKIEMEESIKKINKPLVSIVRVGSLYGTYKPQATLPGKVLARHAYDDKTIRCPSNMVTPTSTRWLANQLIYAKHDLFSELGTAMHHCAPLGSVSVLDWAAKILAAYRSKYDFTKEIYYDVNRPIFSALGTSFSSVSVSWGEVWRRHFRPVDYCVRTRERYERHKMETGNTI